MTTPDIIQLAVGFASGLVGGNIVGALLKSHSLGPRGNSLLGGIAGTAGAYILKTTKVIPPPDDPNSTDLTLLLATILTGIAAGAALILLISLYKGKPKAS